MKKEPTILRIDGSIRISDLARAFALIGCRLSSDSQGEMRVSKQRGPSKKPGPELDHGEPA
jgi:hypothetical protein